MEDFNQSIRFSEYEIQLEDHSLKNQLDTIIISQHDQNFKTNMDKFKVKIDNNSYNKSTDSIESPQSYSKNQEPINFENIPKQQSIRNAQNDLFESNIKLDRSITDQNSNSNINRRSIKRNCSLNGISKEMLKSYSLKDIAMQARNIQRNRQSTINQTKNAQNLNPALIRVQAKHQQSLLNTQDVVSDDTKSKGQNILDFLNGKDKRATKRNLLKQIYYILRITNILKSKLTRKRIGQLQHQHYNIINDLSFFYQPTQQSNQNTFKYFMGEQLQFLIGTILNKIQVFSPDSFFIMLLNCVVLIIQFVQLIVYPLKSVFMIKELQTDLKYEYLFHLVPMFIGVLEICIYFNVSFYEHGIIIKDKGDIFWKYIKNKFLYDIICIIIVKFNYQLSYVPIDLLFAICSLKKIFMNLKNINEHFQIEQRFQTTYDLVNLTLLVFYMAHYCACGYFHVGNTTDKKNNWIEHYGFIHEKWIFNYVNSLYFTFITMVTVGFGDIAPINMYEKIYVIFMTVMSCGVFAYSVNTIGRIFSEMALKEATYKNKKFEITKLMQQRSITSKTQRKVLKFIEYEQNQDVESYQRGEEIMLNVSKSLRDEVNKEYFGKFLNSIKLFRLNFSYDFLMKLTSHIKERSYGPNEIIFSQGDIDRNFYFICKGSVQLYMNSKVSQCRDDDIDLINIGKGSLIGLNSFLTGNPKDISARSSNVSHLIYCSESDFIQTIKLYEQDYEKYCMLRDSVNLYNDHQGLPCFSCKKFDHQTANCSLYNLNLDKQFVNFRHIYSPQQSRNQTGRKSKRKKNIINSLLDKENYSHALKKLRLFYVQQLYENSSLENDEDEHSVDHQNEDHGKELSESVSENSSCSEKSTYTSKISKYKSDREFFLNTLRLRQKDLQHYFISEDNHSFNDSDLGVNETYTYNQDQQTQFDDDDDFEDKFEFVQSTHVKVNSESSFISEYQKNKKNENQNISQQLIQNHNRDSFQIFSPNGASQVTIKVNQDYGPDENRKRSSSQNIDGQQYTPTYMGNQQNGECKRQSVYKQATFANKRLSQMSSANMVSNQEQNNDSINQFRFSQNLIFGDEDKQIGDNPEINHLKKKLRLQKQVSREVQDNQDPDSGQILVLQKVQNSNNKPSSIEHQKSCKVNIQQSLKRMSMSANQIEQFRQFQQNQPNPQSPMTDNIAFNALKKQKLSVKNLSNFILFNDFPAKHFDIFDQFDKYKDFQYYFPSFNSSLILKEQRKRAYQQQVILRLSKLQGVQKFNNAQENDNFATTPKKQNGLQLLVKLQKKTMNEA